MNQGEILHQFCKDLWPICRSITGEGIRQSLRYIQEIIPINIHEIKTGTQVFDWTVPLEWNIRDAYIIAPNGEKIIDFNKNNLHVVGYSTPIDKTISLQELQKNLYSLEDMPSAIPYITSYYKERWGFCISHQQRLKLTDGEYKVFIDSDLKQGHLTYADLIIPGKSEKEIFLSTYLCHPSMANNELSGPAVTTYIAKWLKKASRKYTYRIVFIPETIGSLVYLSQHLQDLQKNVVAGYNLTCLGDNRQYSWMPSRLGNTYADKIAKRIFSTDYPEHIQYSYLERGSDERQYCSPGIDLPIASLFRTKYNAYAEYHTSLDNLDLVTPDGLNGGFQLVKKCLEEIEKNSLYIMKCLCEPQLGKRGLYPATSTKDTNEIVRDMLNLITYADGTNDLHDLSQLAQIPLENLDEIAKKLVEANLMDVY